MNTQRKRVRRRDQPRDETIGAAVDEAIEAAGGPTALGKYLARSRSSVIEWQQTAQVPVVLVLPIEKLTGVPRWRLRPDVYPPEEYQ